MPMRFHVEFSKVDGEPEEELVASQREPQTIWEALERCRRYRAHARLIDATGANQGRIDPEGGFWMT